MDLGGFVRALIISVYGHDAEERHSGRHGGAVIGLAAKGFCAEIIFIRTQCFFPN